MVILLRSNAMGIFVNDTVPGFMRVKVQQINFGCMQRTMHMQHGFHSVVRALHEVKTTMLKTSRFSKRTVNWQTTGHARQGRTSIGGAVLFEFRVIWCSIDTDRLCLLLKFFFTPL